MDLLTHGIMGATLAQCGFQKSLGRKAILWGALAAMLPDIDVLVEVFAGPLASFKYHRWITHSLWFGPLIGSVLGYLLWHLNDLRQALSQSFRSLPTLLQPYVRHLLIRYQDQICVGTHRAPEFRKPIQWQCRQQLPNACAKILINAPIGQRFSWFSDHYYVAEGLDDNVIRFHDLRFTVPGQPLQGLWGVEGKCLPQPQLYYFRHKLTFSWQRLKMLNIYWKDEG